MSHRGDPRNVHQTDAHYSSSGPVLGLKQLSNSLRGHRGQPPPAGHPGACRGGRVSGLQRDGASRVHQGFPRGQDVACERGGSAREWWRGCGCEENSLGLSQSLPRPAGESPAPARSGAAEHRLRRVGAPGVGMARLSGLRGWGPCVSVKGRGAATQAPRGPVPLRCSGQPGVGRSRPGPAGVPCSRLLRTA